MAKRAASRIRDRVFCGFQSAHRAHDIAEADAAAFPRQAIAAGWATNADQDPVAHQFLQNRLEVAARDTLTRRDFRRTNWDGATIIGNVEYRLDREQELFGQPHHFPRAALAESSEYLARVSPRWLGWTSRLCSCRSLSQSCRRTC